MSLPKSIIPLSRTSVRLRIHVKPNAASPVHCGIVGIRDAAVEVRVAAPARDGAANEAVAALLRRVLDAKRERLVVGIARGLQSRDKIVAVDCEGGGGGGKSEKGRGKKGGEGEGERLAETVWARLREAMIVDDGGG